MMHESWSIFIKHRCTDLWEHTVSLSDHKSGNFRYLQRCTKWLRKKWHFFSVRWQGNRGSWDWIKRIQKMQKKYILLSILTTGKRSASEMACLWNMQMLHSAVRVRPWWCAPPAERIHTLRIHLSSLGTRVETISSAEFLVIAAEYPTGLVWRSGLIVVLCWNGRMSQVHCQHFPPVENASCLLTSA